MEKKKLNLGCIKKKVCDNTVRGRWGEQRQETVFKISAGDTLHRCRRPVGNSVWFPGNCANTPEMNPSGGTRSTAVPDLW